jgi:hypothetical protein
MSAALRSNASNIAVIIASTGRPEMLAQAILRLRGQSLRPDRILLSVVSQADLPQDADLIAGAECVTGPPGLTAQRNSAIDRLRDDMHRIIVFFDDDYFPSRTAIEGIDRLFAAHPDVVGATGILLADGINGPGISVAEADRLLAADDRRPPRTPGILRELSGLYGCNMAFRGGAIGELRFDERLKLYGWQEDIDFAAQLLPRGKLVKSEAFSGVHLGVKHGRTAGLRLGYSQVVNPVYLSRKGTMRGRYAAKIIVKTVCANHLRMLYPESWVDRVGRVRGNWLGLIDCLRGKVTPERIERL